MVSFTGVKNYLYPNKMHINDAEISAKVAGPQLVSD